MHSLKNILLSVLLLVASIPAPIASAASSCDGVRIIWANGSGATINGTDNNYLDFRHAVENAFGTSSLKYSFYELGTSAHGGHQYPAAAVGVENFTDFATSLGAYVGAGESYTYGHSVEEGTAELRAYIKEVKTSCKNTKFVLGGLSQGAQVISATLPYLNPSDIIYASTFGDPKLYLPEGSGIVPPACSGVGLSEYRAYVPDCHTYEGILKARTPYQPNNFSGKLGAWCNYHDVICSSYINFLNLFDDSLYPHGSYGLSYHADNLYADAANIIAEKVQAAFPKINFSSTNIKRDVAFLIDTTGSMQDDIDAYREEAINLAETILANHGRIALYEYRDVADPFSEVKYCDFSSCSLQIFSNALYNLTTENGGDDQESAIPAMMTALNNLNWQTGAMKSIVLLTDAGFHEEELGYTLDDVVKRSLEIDPVNIFAIVPSRTMEAYVEITSKTGGAVFNIDEDIPLSSISVLARPDVKLPLSLYTGTIGTEFTFDASITKSSSEIATYDWDLDCDGIFEESTTTPSIAKTYSNPISGFIQVRATDANGLSGTMSAKIEVTENVNESPIVSDLVLAKTSADTLAVSFSTNAYRSGIMLNDYFLGITNLTEITLTGIDFSVDNKVTIIPYPETGYASASLSETFSKENSTEIIIPKAPNTGVASSKNVVTSVLY